MSGEPRGASTQSPSSEIPRREVQVRVAVTIGVVCAAVGTVLGLVMALQRRPEECPDGTYFPEGEAGRGCFAYPDGLQGSAVALVSVMLGILIVLVGMLVLSMVAKHERNSTG